MGTTKPRPSGRASVAKVQSLPDKTFIIDNGAYAMKAGYAPDSSPPDDELKALSACSDMPNAIVKTRGNKIYVGSQLNTHVTDWNEMTFRRPVEKGYIVNWEAQKEIWEHSFFDEKTVRSKDLRITDPEETTLLLTEAPNALPALQKNADEIVMEEWGFGGYLRCVGPSLNAWNDVQSLFGDPVVQEANSVVAPRECLLVVDSGYSHTTVTPIYKGQPLQRAIRRLDLGGKHLTNYLKEMVSVRQYNMVEETYIMNEVKEAVCFVSNNFAGDMEQTWKGGRKRGLPEPSEGVMVDYVLPDPNAGKKGFMRPHDPLLNAKKRKGALSGASTEALSEDALVLGNERFAVPEILFTPGDIGMKQAGIPDIIMQSLSVLPTGLHPAFLANVLVVGGNALLPGFVERL
ncbi:actin family protein [Aspergillus sclerotiicarbonarius CBS 121057]|uniref:Actin family protein n=1 Tax=Aspergillus sclerotiicarbonarius (strain CBS 121057 / IBT 28362) TaxID=1448318 RepID=A0A319EVV9_ASPSB|nr:actin family protein [Aspergillus sclerotiicarbonarius CBS 121057]